jgi:hypothetical protein
MRLWPKHRGYLKNECISRLALQTNVGFAMRRRCSRAARVQAAIELGWTYACNDGSVEIELSCFGRVAGALSTSGGLRIVQVYELQLTKRALMFFRLATVRALR